MFSLLLITDINECEAWTNVCNPEREHCLNREGGFDCECNPGFILSGDKNCIGKFVQLYIVVMFVFEAGNV